LEPEGLILDTSLDLTPGPVPVPAPGGGGRGALREIGGWWGLLRFLPSAIRQAFSEREQPGGLPVVEAGQERPADLQEIDFGDSYPIADHTLAEAGAGAEARFAAAEAVAEALATHDAGTDLQDVVGAHAEQEADQGHEVWLAAEQADYDAGTGPYAPGLTGDDTGPTANGQAGTVAAAEAVAELGEVGL
jgi:hypothetical protein